MQKFSVAFQGGINRLNNAPPNSIYDLENAYIEPMGGVRAFRETTTMTGISGVKPWIKWNDQYLTRSHGIENYAFHNNNLYAVRRRDSNGSDPGLKVFGPDYSTSNTFDVSIAPAYVKDVKATTIRFTSTGSNEGVSSGKFVSYLFIPVNKREERGIWLSISYFADINSTAQNAIPKILINCNEETSHVLVYRTREFGLFGTNELKDYNYYYLTTIQPQENPSAFPYMAVLEDRYKWDGDDISKDGDVPPTVPLDIPLNVHGYEYSHTITRTSQVDIPTKYSLDVAAIYDLEPFGANTIYNHAGITMYGGVQWPTRQPGVRMYNVGMDGTETGYYLRVQSFYDTTEGRVYGPHLDLNNCVAATLENRGETGILLFYHDGVSYKQIDEIYPNAYGFYSSNHLADNINITFWNAIINLLDANNIKNIQPYPPSEYVTEKNTVLMSALDRPQEVLFEQFRIPEGEEILGIMNARLSEEENIKAYSFYLLSDKSVYVCDRNEYTVTYDTLIPNIGVRTFSYTHPVYGIYENILAVNTKEGLIFQGTDEHLYYVFGRQVSMIDLVVPNLWYSDDPFSTGSSLGITIKNAIKDISYDLHKDSLYVVLNSNSDIWIYSILRKEWIGKLNLGTIENTMYLPDQGNVVFKLTSNVFKTTIEHGRPLIASLTTQSLLHDSGVLDIKEMNVDFDSIRKENRATFTTPNKTIFLTEPTTNPPYFSGDSENDVGAFLFLYSGNGTTNYHGIVTSATNTSLTLRNFPYASGSGIPVYWYPRMKYNIRLNSAPHPTIYGDYYIREKEKSRIKLKGSGFKFTFTNFDRIRSIDFVVDKVQ